MIDTSCRCFSKAVCDYLNSHPAFSSTKCCIIESTFYKRYITTAWEVSINNTYRRAICDCIEFTMEYAKEFIKWIDPLWTEYKGLKHSAFFKDDGLYEVTDEFEDI